MRVDRQCEAVTRRYDAGMLEQCGIDFIFMHRCRCDGGHQHYQVLTSVRPFLASQPASASLDRALSQPQARSGAGDPGVVDLGLDLLGDTGWLESTSSGI